MSSSLTRSVGFPTAWPLCRQRRKLNTYFQHNMGKLTYQRHICLNGNEQTDTFSDFSMKIWTCLFQLLFLLKKTTKTIDYRLKDFNFDILNLLKSLPI